MAVPAEGLNVPLTWARSGSGGDLDSGYMKPSAGADIGTDSKQVLATAQCSSAPKKTIVYKRQDSYLKGP